MRPRLPGTASPSAAKERSQSRRRVPPTAVPGRRSPGCFWSATRCLATEESTLAIASVYPGPRRSSVVRCRGSGLMMSRFSGETGGTPKSQTPRVTDLSEVTSMRATSPKSRGPLGVILSQWPRGRGRVDGGLEESVGGVGVEVAGGLGEGDELGGAAEGVESEGAVLFGEAEVFGNFGGEGGAVGLFFEEFGVDDRRLRVVRVG